ncbi:unnamed protein product [Lepeophtheirus salmonis]|uniref:(salmon louse) hypothetical protein n=1 Tax=Lepeophtheirus salmonis TaxID=72036 RepID=A0A7R8HF00_LEPSM|nr:unnamed protein product [Lepeophtheirus salmonis]CAF3036755.1 unnamed protein product [Lepeophtheirus salmonis]
MTWRTRGKREEVEPPPLQEFDPSSTQNTKRELSQPPALSKTSSASSHSYPEKDLNKSSTQQIHHTTNQCVNQDVVLVFSLLLLILQALIKEAGKKIALCPTMNGSPSNSLRESEDSSL